ncbi:hypothetical protein D3C75_275750 [compost metagenome]
MPGSCEPILTICPSASPDAITIFKSAGLPVSLVTVPSTVIPSSLYTDTTAFAGTFFTVTADVVALAEISAAAGDAVTSFRAVITVSSLSAKSGSVRLTFRASPALNPAVMTTVTSAAASAVFFAVPSTVVPSAAYTVTSVPAGTFLTVTVSAVALAVTSDACGAELPAAASLIPLSRTTRSGSPSILRVSFPFEVPGPCGTYCTSITPPSPGASSEGTVLLTMEKSPLTCTSLILRAASDVLVTVTEPFFCAG